MADKNLLLVEGPDDQFVIQNLIQRHRVALDFEYKQKGGIDTLLETLDVELLGSDRERLGILVDADTDLAKQWKKLALILKYEGYTPPINPDSAGTILTPPQPNRPIVGIWLMPDNRLPGMLEDFIAFLVPPDDFLWKKAQDDVAAIPEAERRFRKKVSKANIHTWLAWQKIPGTPLGNAINRKYLTANTPEVHTLLDWLRRLFL